LGLGYLTVHGSANDPDSAFIDFAWLDSQKAVRETSTARHVQLEAPLRIYLDGRQGKATILKPSNENPDAIPEATELTGG
jgi:hypothetical protein